MSPFFYFFYFGILTKRYGHRNSHKILIGRCSSGIGGKMSVDLGPRSKYQTNLITSNEPKPGDQPTNIIVNNTAIVHMPVTIWNTKYFLITFWQGVIWVIFRMGKQSTKQSLFREQLSKQPLSRNHSIKLIEKVRHDFFYLKIDELTIFLHSFLFCSWNFKNFLHFNRRKYRSKRFRKKLVEALLISSSAI